MRPSSPSPLVALRAAVLAPVLLAPADRPADDADVVRALPSLPRRAVRS